MRVILESPYAGKIETNIRYARMAMRDSIMRGEHPIASHLLYTQPGILKDEIPLERERGIEAGFAWHCVAEMMVVYHDYGFSAGMQAAMNAWVKTRKPVVYRMIGKIAAAPAKEPPPLPLNRQ